ncbi:MAG: BamA/TamA family outer membrane protein [Gammaproteobacteria bacterium]
MSDTALIVFLTACVALTSPMRLHAEAMPDPSIDAAPDLRESESPVVVRERNFVVVPLPLSNPTLGTGLVLGGAYFYSQTPEQKKLQPASMTGAAGMYTSNESYAFGVFQQNYWGGDTWRFAGALGYADIKLDLLRPDAAGGVDIDWNVRGTFLQAKLSRRIVGDWYLGVRGRYFDNEQQFAGTIQGDPGFKYDFQLVTAGLGLNLEFDSRDLPTNPSTGRKFELTSLRNDEVFGSDDEYETYTGKFLSYHPLIEKLVLAWELRACYQSGDVPLWDACKVHLRGFPMQQYLGKTSASAQAEGRWTPWKTIGFVAFTGAGMSDRNYTDLREDDLIPSYGVGFRWMVLKSQRINLRIDYARSDDEDAWYLAVGEAF